MTRHIKLIIFVLSVVLATVVLVARSNFLLAQESQKQPKPQAAQPSGVPSSKAKPILVDNFESGSITNVLGGRTNVYVKAPSKAMVSFRKDTREGKPTNVLMVRYDKKLEGGPYDSGGWCGYYTLLKKAHPDVSSGDVSGEDVYLDASQYNVITLWVKGDKGKENFVLGLADAHWDKIGDSVKSQEIGKYLLSGKVTTEWQKAVVPMDEFFVDYTKLSSIAIAFESDCFLEGKCAGVFYIDDIMLE